MIFKHYGKKSEDGEVTATDGVEADGNEAVTDWKKRLEYASYGLVACAALFGFIFAFLTGVSLRAETGQALESFYIYHYFSNAYTEISKLVTVANNGTALASYYFPAVVGTLIAAASIILPLVFGSLTISAAVRKFAYKKEGVNFYKPAVLTYLSFAACATAFLALRAGSGEISGIRISIGFSDATLAGLIVGGIMLGAFTLCSLAVRFADVLAKKENCAAIITSVVAAVLAVAIVAVLAMPTITFSYNGSSTSVGYAEFMSMISRSEITKAIACSVVGFAVQIVMLALAFKMLFSFKWYATTGQSDATLGTAIANLVLSGANIAMAYVSGGAYIEEMGSQSSSYTLSCSCGAPIALAVLSILVLIAAILFKIYSGKTVQNTMVATEDIEG